MNVWLPVYGFEKSYEINIVDGLVRKTVKDITKSETPIPNVPIEVTQNNKTLFLGYGVKLLDENNIEHLLPIDKIVVEAIKRKPINQKIYHKNNFIIDCCYKNLTLNPLPEPAKTIPATVNGTYYQYKAVKTHENGKEKKCYALHKVYSSYEDFTAETGLDVKDFYQDEEPVDNLKVGIYMWSTRDLGFEPLESLQNANSNQLAFA